MNPEGLNLPTLTGTVPESVGGDGHDALRALLGREPGRVLERLVRQRRQVEAVLVRVAQPRPTRHRQHLKHILACRLALRRQGVRFLNDFKLSGNLYYPGPTCTHNQGKKTFL